MSTEDADNGTSPTPPLPWLLVSTTEQFPPRPAPPRMVDPLSITVVLVCIFLLLATLLVFVSLCKPVVLDRSHFGPGECMPHHPADAGEPQLRLWKRLGSLRCSINTFRRSQPVSQGWLAHPRNPPTSQDWHVMESTKM